MRTFGMYLLGLGIVLLVMCIFPMADAENTRDLLGWLACTAVVPLPMIVLGILLIRRAEDRAQAQQAAAEIAPAEGESSPALVPTNGPSAATPDAVPSLLDRIRMFDLNQLNWIGWLLFFATLGFLGLVIFAADTFLDTNDWSWGKQRLAGVVLLFLAVGFFVVVQRLLHFFGISIFRQMSEKQTSEPPEEKNSPI